MYHGLFVGILFCLIVFRAQAQHVTGDVPTPIDPQYLPLVVNPGPTPTPTATATLIPTPTAIATPTATPTLPPASYNNCQTEHNPSAAPHYPIRILRNDKDLETVTLQNVSAVSVNFAGWHMCSITGNQQHPLVGGLSPGQTLTFPNLGEPIWDNDNIDDGALYNTAGQLVSYWRESFPPMLH